MWVGERSKKYKNTFTLIGPTCQYQISAEDIDVWVRQIEHAIKQHFEYLAVTQDSELKKEKEANMSYDNPMRYGTYEFPTCESFSGWWKDGKVIEIFYLSYPFTECLTYFPCTSVRGIG